MTRWVLARRKRRASWSVVRPVSCSARMARTAWACSAGTWARGVWRRRWPRIRRGFRARSPDRPGLRPPPEWPGVLEFGAEPADDAPLLLLGPLAIQVDEPPQNLLVADVVGPAVGVLLIFRSGGIGPRDFEEVTELIEEHRGVGTLRGARRFPTPEERVNRGSGDSRVSHVPSSRGSALT